MKPKQLAVVAEECASCKYFQARRAVIGANPAYLPIGGLCRRFPAAEAKLPGDWCGEYSKGMT